MLGDQEPDIIITDNKDALLTALDSIYPRVPRILYRQHIKKNVLTAAQQRWRVTHVSDEEKVANQVKLDKFMQRQNEVVYAELKQQFEDLYILLKMDYSDQPLLVQYLEDNKYPLRHLFTQVWTNEIRHYSHVITSRIEKRHDVMKKFISTSKYDLFKVVKVIEDYYKV